MLPSKKLRIITLCGSTRFKKEFQDTYKRLSVHEGAIVLTVAIFSHADRIELTTDQRDRLEALHLGKIDLCDEVYVLDVGGYIGKGCQREIEYANKVGKPIRYLSAGFKPLEHSDDFTL